MSHDEMLALYWIIAGGVAAAVTSAYRMLMADGSIRPPEPNNRGDRAALVTLVIAFAAAFWPVGLPMLIVWYAAYSASDR